MIADIGTRRPDGVGVGGTAPLFGRHVPLVDTLHHQRTGHFLEELVVEPAGQAADLDPRREIAWQKPPVAILGAEGFDPTSEVDIESILAHGASPSSTRFDEDDVNGDGYLDLVVYFRARDLDDPSAEECGNPAAVFTLEGSLISGGGFVGTDSVTWLGC